jgi:hypothetical protein
MRIRNSNGTIECKCLLDNGTTRENNQENEYNHNFEGVYCYCDAPSNVDDTMFQCVMCMDWFHQECISKMVNEVFPLVDFEGNGENTSCRRYL